MAGNSNSGRQRFEKPWEEALRVEGFSEDKKKLRQLAKVTWSRALSGDMAAVKEIADRLDGKPVQIIEGDVEHTHNFVRAPEKASEDEWKRFLAQRDKASALPVKRTNGRGNGTAH